MTRLIGSRASIGRQRMHHIAHTTALLQAAQTLSDFRDWVADSADELLDAVDLLGGPAWLPVALRAVHTAENGEDLAALLPDLRRLSRLLRLEFADRLGSEEARRFLRIHPDDPRADSARLCAEAVDRGLQALERVRSIDSPAAA